MRKPMLHQEHMYSTLVQCLTLCNDRAQFTVGYTMWLAQASPSERSDRRMTQFNWSFLALASCAFLAVERGILRQRPAIHFCDSESWERRAPSHALSQSERIIPGKSSSFLATLLILVTSFLLRLAHWSLQATVMTESCVE